MVQHLAVWLRGKGLVWLHSLCAVQCCAVLTAAADGLMSDQEVRAAWCAVTGLSVTLMGCGDLLCLSESLLLDDCLNVVLSWHRSGKRAAGAAATLAFPIVNGRHHEGPSIALCLHASAAAVTVTSDSSSKRWLPAQACSSC